MTKKILGICLLVFFGTLNKNSYCQIIDCFPAIQAEYPGGEDALYKFLSDTIYNGIDFKQIGDTTLQKMFCQFTVTETGKITDVKVVKTSNSKYVDDFVISRLKIMPNWIPGKMNGKPIPQLMTLPIILEME